MPATKAVKQTATIRTAMVSSLSEKTKDGQQQYQLR